MMFSSKALVLVLSTVSLFPTLGQTGPIRKHLGNSPYDKIPRDLPLSPLADLAALEKAASLLAADVLALAPSFLSILKHGAKPNISVPSINSLSIAAPSVVPHGLVIASAMKPSGNWSSTVEAQSIVTPTAELAPEGILTPSAAMPRGIQPTLSVVQQISQSGIMMPVVPISMKNKNSATLKAKTFGTGMPVLARLNSTQVHLLGAVRTSSTAIPFKSGGVPHFNDGIIIHNRQPAVWSYVASATVTPVDLVAGPVATEATWASVSAQNGFYTPWKASAETAIPSLISSLPFAQKLATASLSTTSSFVLPNAAIASSLTSAIVIATASIPSASPSSFPITNFMDITLTSSQWNPPVVSSAVVSNIPTASPAVGSGKSTFDATATDNVAVYYGQGTATQATGLLDICRDPAVNLVNLAFVNTFFGENDQPSATFGPACTGNSLDDSSSSSGQMNCTLLGQQITQCQTYYNTKVMLSLGGNSASSAFGSSAQAIKFADTMWNLFGGGTNKDASTRPFGTAIVDGFDIDNEDHSMLYYIDFAKAIKSHYATDPSRQYFLSAAPQCPHPDTSIPQELMQMADFVWVQFYNNAGCSLDDAGFADSFQTWTQSLAANGTGTGPKIYVGALTWPGAGPGYVAPSALPSIVDIAKKIDPANFGGFMLWDGSVGGANGYTHAAKASLS